MGVYLAVFLFLFLFSFLYNILRLHHLAGILSTAFGLCSWVIATLEAFGSEFDNISHIIMLL